MRADRSRLPEVGPDPIFRFPLAVRHRLANGLDVRTVEHRTVPVVACVLQIQGGAGADPPGEEGLVAITADMVDEGTGDLSAIDVSEGFARIGAEYDVDVGPDATLFGLTVLSRFVERGMSLLADLVVRPSLRETDFDRVRKLRLDRLHQLKDLPPAVAERAFLQLIYGEHPYGHLPIGTETAVQACRLERVAEFHAATFRPARATLVVAGPMSHETLLAVADEAFSRWPAGTPAGGSPGAADIEPTATRCRLALVPRAGAPQSELRIGHLSARRNSPDYHALLVMNAVLGGQFVSRINLRLREEKGYTYGARTGFDWRRGLGPFSLQASVDTAATADAIRDTLAEFGAIRSSRPPSEEEMVLAKASLTRGYPRNFETAPQVARSVAHLALYDLPDSYFEEFIPCVDAVESADVVRVAERHVDPARATTLIVGDHQAVADSLGPLGLGELQVLPAQW
jgi:predicted Zn-dependent peptidase